jgi:protein-S-isoprenylcysteine O-methyltransferase Ste14
MQDPGPTRKNDTREALLRAVSGRDANAQLPVVARTRRAIRIANDTRREQGKRERNHIGITIFVLGAIFVVLAPAMWGSLDDFFGGEHFGDLPTQVTLLSTFLMLAVVCALVVIWCNRASQDEYRQDH